MTRILMIATSADRMTPGTEPTGVWLEELTTPYYAFRDGGADVGVPGCAPIRPQPKLAGKDSNTINRGAGARERKGQG